MYYYCFSRKIPELDCSLLRIDCLEQYLNQRYSDWSYRNFEGEIEYYANGQTILILNPITGYFCKDLHTEFNIQI